MRIGDEVYIHGYVDEIRKDTVIIRNDGGYFGTVANEIIEPIGCKNCKWCDVMRNGVNAWCNKWGINVDVYDFCSRAERREE